MAQLEKLFAKYDRLVLFDTETTGLVFHRDEIIEFAAVVLEMVDGQVTVVKEYDELVTRAKLAWLEKHLASVKFDEIHIVKYGTPKHTIGKGILFDDELPNRTKWGEGAYEPKDIFEVLGELK